MKRKEQKPKRPSVERPDDRCQLACHIACPVFVSDLLTFPVSSTNGGDEEGTAAATRVRGVVKSTAHESNTEIKITHDNCIGGGGGDEEHFTQTIVENQINSIHECKFNRTYLASANKRLYF